MEITRVETKYRIDDLGELVAVLAARGIMLSEPAIQDDQAYAPASWSYGMSKIGVPFARLRTQVDRHVFTVKKPVDNELACLEHECDVSDRTTMHAALMMMDWAPTVRIVKQRRAGSWSGATVCLDVIDQLGVFVEVERMVGLSESGGQVQAQLDATVHALGVCR